ncbi:hypothetical protein CYPRO_0654 [Cyclonatronum proteinivorum]|uniref:Uncharacterized protein n=1 Tax=Cyclonatronum proteinivorum TaxID=1457365 RepID=A0A345UHI6_9BACT|nr:hypothetical protein CYPRO_0654 [Cyclonatronum proteinivorum]
MRNKQNWNLKLITYIKGASEFVNLKQVREDEYKNGSASHFIKQY